MVVNRKLSVSAAPAVSRTPSTQPTPRPTLQKQSINQIPATLNGKTMSTSQSSRKSERRHKKKKKTAPHRSFLQILFFLVLSAFSVYTATVCSISSTSQICKPLDAYRARIFDPYLLPPIKSAIQHSEPYVAPLKPYAAQAATFTHTRIVAPVSTFIDSSLSLYHAEIAPRLHWLLIDQAWNGFIKPTYSDTLHPILERHTRPHRFYYHKIIVPSARKLVYYVEVACARVKPHVQHYLTNAQKNAETLYSTVERHALKIYERLRPHMIIYLDQAQRQLHLVLQTVVDLRKQFIDPHVSKMLDKVENGSGSMTASSSDTPSSDDHPSNADTA
ncbi:hypothetical protein H0H93_000677 [Arthromyces matolae]|nr:hypothetical protein H0H93_000677 [Arthromyces matolae]